MLAEVSSKNFYDLSEEEFGLPSDEPITLPFESTFLNYVMWLVKGWMTEDLEKELISSLSTCHFSASSALALGQSHQEALIYSYWRNQFYTCVNKLQNFDLV